MPPSFIGKISVNKNTYQLGLIAILLFAFLLRIWGNSFGLPLRIHIDEPPYVLAALRIAKGDFNITYPNFSPNIYELLLTLSYGFLFVFQRLIGAVGSATDFGYSYLSNPTPFYLLARSINALLSTIGLLVVFLIGRRLMGLIGAFIATLFLCIAFIDVRHAHFAEPYILISLLVWLAVYLALLFLKKSGNYCILFVSFVFAGIVVALRISLATIILVPMAAVLIKLKDQELVSNKRRYLWYTTSGGVLGFCLGFLIGYPGIFAALDEIVNIYEFYRVAAAGTTGFQGFVLSPSIGWSFYISLLSYSLGVPALILMVFGLFQVLRYADQKLHWIVLLIFPTTYLVLISFSSMSFLRYSVPLIPALSLLVGAGLGWIIERKYYWIATLVGILVFFPSLKNDIMYNKLLTREDTRSQAKYWIEENIPEGSKIALQWFTPSLETLHDPEANSYRQYQTLVIDPFLSDPYYYQLDYYSSLGYQYFVLSNFISELRRVDPREQAMRKDFYDTLERQADLVAEFSPSSGNAELPYIFEEAYGPVISLGLRERPGPTLKIYRLGK